MRCWELHELVGNVWRRVGYNVRKRSLEPIDKHAFVAIYLSHFRKLDRRQQSVAIRQIGAGNMSCHRARRPHLLHSTQSFITVEVSPLPDGLMFVYDMSLRAAYRIRAMTRLQIRYARKDEIRTRKLQNGSSKHWQTEAMDNGVGDRCFLCKGLNDRVSVHRS